MKHCILIGLSLAVILLSCTKERYKTTKDGLAYKYIVHEPDSNQVKVNDYLVLDVKYYSESDSLLFTSAQMPGAFRMRAKAPHQDDHCSIDDALLMLHEGDSAHFLIDAKSFINNTLHDTCPAAMAQQKLRFEIRLKAIQTRKEVEKQKEEILSRRLVQEKELILDFVTQNYPDATPDSAGLYVIVKKTGSGKKLVKGETVTINYEARFLNGELLMNTRQRHQPFEFVLGKQHVIEGLERAVAMNRVGSSFVCIIPSSLGYGSMQHKKVPACSPLVFEVEIMKAQKNH